MNKGLTTKALSGILDQIAEDRRKKLSPLHYHALKIASLVCKSQTRSRAIKRLYDLGQSNAAHAAVYRRAARALERGKEVF